MTTSTANEPHLHRMRNEAVTGFRGNARMLLPFNEFWKIAVALRAEQSA